MEEINQKLEELFSILDNNIEIRELLELKKNITSDDIKLIDNYRLEPTLQNKKKIYENEKLQKYLLLETEINYLIMEINQKFKRGNCCESN